MKTVTTYEIRERDYELLQMKAPADPCTHCPNSYACLGCASRRKRDEILKPIKQAGVFEIWQKVQEVKELERKCREMEDTIDKNKKFVESKGFDLDRIFGTKMFDSMSKVSAF